MPKRCVAAGCDTVGGKGYSLHSFPKDETMRRKWTSAVKRQRAKWDGPSSSSFCARGTLKKTASLRKELSIVTKWAFRP